MYAKRIDPMGARSRTRLAGLLLERGIFSIFFSVSYSFSYSFAAVTTTLLFWLDYDLSG